MLTRPIKFEHPKGRGAVVFQIENVGGRIICGVHDLVGCLDLPPKAWRETMRAVMAILEAKARDAGCHEMRMCGRDWSRIFPDYEPLEGGDPNLIRKRLQ